MSEKSKCVVQTILLLLLLLLILAAIVIGVVIINKVCEYKESDAMYAQVAERFANRLPNKKTVKLDEEKSPVEIDFDELLLQNSDVVGWIYCEDTQIDYPVVQSEDNDYYLHRMIDQSYNYSGTIFLDARCEKDLSNPVSVIYGHNMNNGSMFHSICEYTKSEKESFYEEHPHLYFNTPEQNYKIDIYSVVITPADSYVYTFYFLNDTQYLEWLEKVKDESVLETDVVANLDSKMLVLSTCSYQFENARTCLIGKLVPIG